MTREQWIEVEHVLAFALDLPEGEQSAYLNEACAGRPALRADVESLLAAHQDAGDFIEAAVASVAESETRSEALIGRQIGPYKLVKELGRGGMGTVYRAERVDEQFSKAVAIKLISARVTSAALLRRFRDERQILATLEHPNIARLLDGGVTADGLHYIVMEYVEGVPINQYCDQKALPVEERLKLFQTICSAVHCAHQYLVVHRDIKPGNILVTAEGVPKLLDFGIAKVLRSAVNPLCSQATQTVKHLMTPDYASPEQLRGRTITTATDVYSLGVLLYELLTGRQPYRLAGKTLDEILHVVCEQEPQKPSVVIRRIDSLDSIGGAFGGRPSPESVSKARSTKPGELQNRLSGDLDNIVMTAIRKESQRRYSSVEQFSEDIRRHLEGFPVIARNDTLSYRAGKFMRRHAAAVVAATLILLVLTAGILATTWQARVATAHRTRAERHFNDVRKLADSLIFNLDREIQNIPGATHARAALITTALQYLDGLARESYRDSSLQRELAAAYQRLGDIQGLRGTQNQGNTAGALESYRKSLQLREVLAASTPPNSQARRELASIHSRIGNVFESRNDIAGALENDYRALELREADFHANPSDRNALANVGLGYSNLGRHLGLKGDWAGALKNELRAISIFESLLEAAPADERLRHSLAGQYGQVSYDWNKNGDRIKALQYCAKEQAICEAMVVGHPGDVRAQLDLSANYEHMGSLLGQAGELEKSLESWMKAMAIAQALSAADPKDARAKVGLASALNRVGWLLVRTGKTTEVNDLRKGLALREGLYAADPTNPRRKDTLGNSYATLGDAELILASNPHIPPLKRITHWSEARSSYIRALEIYIELRAKGALRGEDAGEPARIAGEIAKCNTALNYRSPRVNAKGWR